MALVFAENLKICIDINCAIFYNNSCVSIKTSVSGFNETLSLKKITIGGVHLG